MLLEIFHSPLGSGAQLFLLIVCLLAGLGAGLSAIDFRKTWFNNEEEEEK